VGDNWINVYEPYWNEQERKTGYIVTFFTKNPTCTGLGTIRYHDEEQCEMRDRRFSMR
jgi:hypothetical protein